MFRKRYANVFEGPDEWQKVKIAGRPDLRVGRRARPMSPNPPYFDAMPKEPARAQRHRMARAAGASSATASPPTTSRPPARSRRTCPAGEYLLEHQVRPAEFNSYGARRGNHEVMMRGTFANIRIKNEMVPGVEGGITKHLPDGEGDADLRRGDAVQGAKACRWSSSPARNTAPARRATGRPRARSCWA